jgi:hypothetical protein
MKAPDLPKSCAASRNQRLNGPMRSLEERLQDLNPTSVIATLVRDLDKERSIASDRRANYLSLRPTPVGAIAVYTHSLHVSIAVEPAKAVALRGTMPYADQILKTPATTYLVVKDTDLNAHFKAVLELAIQSVDWRASGPSMTLGSGHQNKPVVEVETCPNCWTQVTPAGECWC